MRLPGPKCRHDGRGYVRRSEFKTYMVRASKEEPQYLMKSDTTDHLAMHKGSALKRLKSKP